MKTNKEYPATHSMATSWFAIDEDGNVAIMNYEDNGPVPVGTPEASLEEIIMSTFSTKVEGKPWRSLPLSKEEIQYLMDNSEEYPDRLSDGEGFYHTLVKVCKDKMDAFEEAAEVFNDDEYGNTVCIDKEDGLFYLDWFAYDKAEKKAIRKIESLGVIEPLRKIFPHGEDDCCELKGLPFYGYQQWYSPWLPMEKLYAPSLTFKEDRLSPKLRELAHRVPVKFSDAYKIQIAEHLPYSSYDNNNVLINNRKYTPFNDADDQEFYLAQESIYYASCGLKCMKCYGDNDINYWSYPLQRSKKPTVLIITDTRMISDEYERSSDIIFANAVYLPIVEGIPHSGNWKSSGERDLAEYPIAKFFSHCKVNLERNVDFFRPRVILLYKEIIPYLTKHYEIKDDQITILGESYPVYVLEDIEKSKESITQLASMPYRGGDIQWRISGDEVDKDKL